MNKKQAKAERESAAIERIAARKKAAEGSAASKTRKDAGNNRARAVAQEARGEKNAAQEPQGTTERIAAREIFDALNTYRSLYWKSVDSIAAFRTAVAEDEPDEKQLTAERVMVRAMRAVVKGGVCVRHLAEKNADVFGFAAQSFCEALAADENARLCDASLENEIQALAFAARAMAADAEKGIAADAAICKTPKEAQK